MVSMEVLLIRVPPVVVSDMLESLADWVYVDTL